ncbi:MAG: class I SAM-dependent methyltransferase [Mangrovicoccus sp.]|nr:class I SAM-dependent methyltransferase [Mangrovicoccus sp.]
MTRTPPLERITRCRGCQRDALEDLIGFGTAPIADHLRHPEDQSPEYAAPLTLAHCPHCGLCQIRETVEPRVLFGPDYPYFSSVSPALMAYFRASAEDLIAARNLGPDSLVIEAASNDGYMLSVFHEAGIGVLGIDPADGPVKVAQARGIDTRHAFFGADLGAELAGQNRRADVFLANNVLAHVADTNDFVAGISAVLADTGLAVIEFPYLLNMLDIAAFDTIYHQHLLYLALTPLLPLFARHGLHINDVVLTKIHGGTARIFASKTPGQSDALRQLLAEETRRGIKTRALYGEFLAHLEQMKTQTHAALAALRAQGKSLAGYGAAAKSTTLLHYLGLGRDEIAFILDKSPHKQGLQMPVTGIPIRPPEALKDSGIDHVLILAWNFAREIVAENPEFLQAGGQFFVPIPDFRTYSTAPESASI